MRVKMRLAVAVAAPFLRQGAYVVLAFATRPDIVQPIRLSILLLVHCSQVFRAVVHFIVRVQAVLVLQRSASPRAERILRRSPVSAKSTSEAGPYAACRDSLLVVWRQGRHVQVDRRGLVASSSRIE